MAKAAKQEERTPEAVFNEALLSALPDGVITFAADGQCRSANQAAADLVGVPLERLLAQNFRKISSWADSELRARAEETIRTGSSQHWETYFTSTARRSPWLHFRLERVNLGGEPTVLLILVDISDRKQREESLRLTQFSVDHAADMVQWIAPDGRILYASESSCRRFGYSREEMLTKTVFDLDPNMSPETWPEHWRRLKERGSTIFESWDRTQKGELFPVEVSANYVESDGQEYIFGFARDVTERKKTEEALRLTQLSVDRAADLIHWIGPDGRLLYVSDSTCRRHGYSREEMLGLTIFDLDPAQSPSAWRKHWREIKEHGSLVFESVHRTKDGEVFPIELTVNYVECDGKEYNFSFGRDISERKKLDQALRDSDQRYRALFENANDIISIYDLEGQFLEINGAAAERLGYDRSELLGMKVTELRAPEVVSSFSTDMAALKQSGKLTYETTLRRADGSMMPVEVSSRLIDYGGGQAALSVSRDMTERRQAEEALRASEEKYAKAFHGSPDAVLITRVSDGRVVEVNEGFTKLSGFERDEALRSSALALDLWAEPGDRERCMAALQSNGSVSGMDFSFRVKSGEILQCLYAGALISVDGEPHVLSVVRDVTEQRRTEAAVRKSEELLRGILDNLQDAYVRTDLDGRFVMVSPSAARLFGYGSADDMIGLPAESFYADRADHEAIGQQLQKSGHVVDYVGQGRKKDGGTFWLSLNAQFFHDEQGNVAGREGFTRDVTERERAKEGLQESARLHQIILDCMPCVALLLRSKSREVVAMNAAAAKAGVTLGKTCFGSWPRFAEPCSWCLAPEVWATGEERHLEVEAMGVVWEAHWVPVSDDLYMHYAFDMTEPKALEAQLRQAQKMESVGRLAGGVAHDFNNMLGVILGHAEMALEQVDPAQPLHADLTEIRKAAQRSADLTRQLLAFARKQTIAPQVLDLNETVGSMLSMLERLIGEDIDLTWRPQADLWPVKVDPSQIDQILANLCVNARDAINGVGEVTIETASGTFDAAYCAKHAGFVPGEYVRLGVRDDGCGMEKETLGQLFEPFFTTKGVGEGTGLGLATVYGIVKQNNGFINVYSEPGKGTTVTIYLPRHAAKAEQPRKESPLAPAARGHETVLVAEDEPAILKMTVRMLEHQGYTVLAASTPGEAIRLAREHAGEIHLLMTDVVMPEMNGRDLAKNLLSLYPDLRRLFMSGYTADIIAHDGVLDEGVYFIQKPFSVQALAAKVRDALDSE